MIDDTLIDATVKAVIEKLLENLEPTIETQIAAIRIRAEKLNTLFKTNMTLQEIKEAVGNASIKQYKTRTRNRIHDPRNVGG